MELWDLYDRNRKPLNKLHKRGEPIPTGAYHIAVSIMTVNSKGEILITLRSAGKHPYPNMWEITAGSVVAGEDSRTAAKRELAEETGIVVDDSELKFIHTNINSHSSGFMDMYIVRKDVDSVRLQKGETEAAKWVTVEEFDRLIESGKVAPPVVRRFGIYRKFL